MWIKTILGVLLMAVCFVSAFMSYGKSGKGGSSNKGDKGE